MLSPDAPKWNVLEISGMTHSLPLRMASSLIHISQSQSWGGGGGEGRGGEKRGGEGRGRGEGREGKREGREGEVVNSLAEQAQQAKLLSGYKN